MAVPVRHLKCSECGGDLKSGDIGLFANGFVCHSTPSCEEVKIRDNTLFPPLIALSIANRLSVDQIVTENGLIKYIEKMLDGYHAVYEEVGPIEFWVSKVVIDGKLEKTRKCSITFSPHSPHRDGRYTLRIKKDEFRFNVCGEASKIIFEF